MDPVVSTGAAVALASSAPATFVLKSIFGASLDEIGQFLADPIRERRTRRTVEVAERTAAILAERDVQPRELPDDVTVPLLDAATLTDNDTLQDMWARLLASHVVDASTPSALTAVLGDLSPTEARVLTAAGDVLGRMGYLGSGPNRDRIADVSLVIGNMLTPPIDEPELTLVKENLVRLRVLATGSVSNTGTVTFGKDQELRLARADTGVVVMAPLGVALIEAVVNFPPPLAGAEQLVRKPETASD